MNRSYRINRATYRAILRAGRRATGWCYGDPVAHEDTLWFQALDLVYRLKRLV